MPLTTDQTDALQELLNIGVGRAAGALNQMLGKPIRLHIPSIAFDHANAFTGKVAQTGSGILASVQLPFQGSFSGSASLLFPVESATTLVAALTDDAEPADELDGLKEATLTEVGNIVLNGVMGSMGNILQKQLTYSIPYYEENTIQGLMQSSEPESDTYLLWAQTHFSIQDYNLSGDILLMFHIGGLEKFLDSLLAFNESSVPVHATS